MKHARVRNWKAAKVYKHCRLGELNQAGGGGAWGGTEHRPHGGCWGAGGTGGTSYIREGKIVSCEMQHERDLHTVNIFRDISRYIITC